MAKAKLNREYALRLVGVGVIMFGFSVWSIYDGKVAWPKANAELDDVRDELIKLSDEGVTPADFIREDEDGRHGFLLKSVFEAKGHKVPDHLIKELSNFAEDESIPKEELVQAEKQLFEKPVYSPNKLMSQYIQAVVTAIFGFCVIAAVWVKRDISYEVDENGLRGNGFGGELSWSDVASVDWSKWEDKAIMWLVLNDGRKIKLDGWHYAGMSEISKEIFKHFPRK